MISSDVLRGYNDIMILYFLLEHDSYGYEISRSIQEHSGGTYTMKETTLYSIFNRLEKNGHIASYYGDETFGRRRTYFTITDSGRAYYQEKCEEWNLTRQLISRFIHQQNEKGDR